MTPATTEVRRAVKRIQKDIEDDLYLAVYQASLEDNPDAENGLKEKIKTILAEYLK